MAVGGILTTGRQDKSVQETSAREHGHFPLRKSVRKNPVEGLLKKKESSQSRSDYVRMEIDKKQEK